MLLIVFAIATEPTMFPYMVSLQYNGIHFCGGVIIQSDVVLTAGHCVNDRHNWATIEAVAGVDDLNDRGQVRVVKLVYVHENYENGLHPFIDTRVIRNDLAVLKLDRGFHLNNVTVASIKLANRITETDQSKNDNLIFYWVYLTLHLRSVLGHGLGRGLMLRARGSTYSVLTSEDDLRRFMRLFRQRFFRSRDDLRRERRRRRLR